jgi:hypothetical protein
MPDHLRSGAVDVRRQTGKLLIRLGQREKADIAFASAVEDCALYEKDYNRESSLKYTNIDHEGVLKDKPDRIYTWNNYDENYGRVIPLKKLLNGSLFSWYGIE